MQLTLAAVLITTLDAPPTAVACQRTSYSRAGAAGNLKGKNYQSLIDNAVEYMKKNRSNFDYLWRDRK
ncbi:MAG: hypothetical protein BGP13_02480 [Sphingobacteriales bacterium 40-81]|nr:MAG: hypothetical protein BGP13_02480 [Sphingobacteriales bacterium 40-81]